MDYYHFLQILILGLVQGAAELLPVSSSAHVIVAEKLMGLDPSSPEMTFLLVMLHTGTMFAVIVYFWNSWLDHYCSDASRLGEAAKNIVAATGITVVVGFALKLIIEKVVLHGEAKAEVEELFSNLYLIGGGLFAAGVLIIFSGSTEEKWRATEKVDVMKAMVIGAVQGLCLPFRGFSRSGATISTGLLVGVERRQIEEFSFALAVVLTPIVVLMELWRLIRAHPEMTHGSSLVSLLEPGLLGMLCSFAAGYLALKLLSSLLEGGRWKYFGYYCFVASVAVFALAFVPNAAAGATATSLTPVDAAPTIETPVATTNSPASAMPSPTPTNAAPANPDTNVPPVQTAVPAINPPQVAMTNAPSAAPASTNAAP